MRRLEPYLSTDVEHIENILGIAGQLGKMGHDLLFSGSSVPGFTPGAFDDALHLSPEGAKIYSRALAEKLAPVLAAELRGDLRSSR